MFPTFRGIVTHIELQHFRDAFAVFDRHLFKTDIRSDELLKLIRIDLTETFETGDLCRFAQFRRNFVPFLFRITVMRLVFQGYKDDRS